MMADWIIVSVVKAMRIQDVAKSYRTALPHESYLPRWCLPVTWRGKACCNLSLPKSWPLEAKPRYYLTNTNIQRAPKADIFLVTNAKYTTKDQIIFNIEVVALLQSREFMVIFSAVQLKLSWGWAHVWSASLEICLPHPLAARPRTLFCQCVTQLLSFVYWTTQTMQFYSRSC